MRKTTLGFASLALLLGAAPAIALAADSNAATPDEVVTKVHEAVQYLNDKGLAGFSDFGLVAADGLSVDDAEAPVLLPVSARQMAGPFATAMPMPRATASAPTRPMNRAWPDPAGLPMRCSVVAVSICAPKMTNNCRINAK